LHEVQKARDLWIAAARADGKTIPLPKGRLKNKITFLMVSICSSNQSVDGVSQS
jgi:hypothetical protein